MTITLDSVQAVVSLPPLETVPDDKEDQPVDGPPLGRVGPLAFPALVYGAAALSDQYNTEDRLTSDNPIRTVRLALRYGINAFDTSAFYGVSEIVLGSVLKSLEADYPRASYILTTKCGRYDRDNTGFDYSPSTIRRSVERSLKRLNTSYLDVVYLHDVEFVCTPVQPRASGEPTIALRDEKVAYGLGEGDEGKIWGEGDQKILDAVTELRRMQEEGLIKHVGITGYPLPTLLRLALLILNNPPYKPVDVILSYSHLSLQNSALHAFAPHFFNRAKVTQILSASPLSMGLLSPSWPAWHPAPPAMQAAAIAAVKRYETHPGGLPSLACAYSFRLGSELGMPSVVGLSTPKEVHEAVRAFREMRGGPSMGFGERRLAEEEVKELFVKEGMLEWSWASPP